LSARQFLKRHGFSSEKRFVGILEFRTEGSGISTPRRAQPLWANQIIGGFFVVPSGISVADALIFVVR